MRVSAGRSSLRVVLLGDLHTSRPSVYLDQWVWVRLASVVEGKPRAPGDAEVLDAIREAAAAGVAFPLSRTHYIETSSIKKPKQRQDLARVMASISFFRTLRGGQVLIRHQMLNAMHETFGRPTFKPPAPEALGLGVSWAFTGRQGFMRVMDKATGLETTEAALPGVGKLRRELSQLAETMIIAGPADDEVEALRANGYRPEATEEGHASRLAWEELLVDMLRDDPVHAEELRVRVTARELCHEYLDLLNELMAEYRLTLERALGSNPDRPGSGRPKLMAFSDRVPSMRLAVDMKTALFRNGERVWKPNDLHDIDALSQAIPYCHAVVTDKDAADRAKRTGGGERNGTAVLSKLDQLVELLPDLVQRAQAIGGDPTGWDAAGPGEGFMATLSDGTWPSLNVTGTP